MWKLLFLSDICIMDDQLCSHCGENGLEVDRHCDEMLQCCRVCGIAQAMPDKNLVKEDLSQHFFQQRTNHSPKRKVLVLPNQVSNYYGGTSQIQELDLFLCSVMAL